MGSLFLLIKNFYGDCSQSIDEFRRSNSVSNPQDLASRKSFLRVNMGICLVICLFLNNILGYCETTFSVISSYTISTCAGGSEVMTSEWDYSEYLNPVITEAF